jgi:hypothetical protein
MAERLPVALRTRQQVRKIASRGIDFDFMNYQTVDIVKYETDFLGDTIDGLLAAGGAGTAAALVSGRIHGSADLVTGAVDNQCSILYLPFGNVQGNQNPVLQARIYVDSIATGDVMVGFVDSVAAGVLAATGVGPFVSPLASPPTLTAGVADAVALMYDLSSALANPSFWRLCYSQASTAAIATALSTTPAIRAPTALTYQWLTLQIRRSPSVANNCGATAWINNVKVADVNSLAITGNVALWPFILIGATSGASRTLTCDYFSVTQDRDTNA